MASKRGTKRRFTSEEVAKLLQEDDSTDNDSDADIDDSASDSDFLDNTTQEAQSTDASSDSDTEGYAVDGDYCSSYAFTRKSLKWWRKTFFWLLEVAVVNSYILYNETHPDEPVDHIRYRKQLILQLVGEQRRSRPSRRRGRPSTLDKEERLDKRQHFIAAFSGKKTKDCRVCSDRKTAGSRHKTIYYCETCSRHPGLHPGDCFKKYHSQTKFR